MLYESTQKNSELHLNLGPRIAKFDILSNPTYMEMSFFDTQIF